MCIIKEIYIKATATICLEKRKVKINLRRNVRQVDTILPKLLTAVLENVFKKVKWENKGIRKIRKYRSHLRFIEDILMFSNSFEEFQ